MGPDSSEAIVYAKLHADGRGALTCGAETGDDVSFEDVLHRLGETMAKGIAGGR